MLSMLLWRKYLNLKILYQISWGYLKSPYTCLSSTLMLAPNMASQIWISFPPYHCVMYSLLTPTLRGYKLITLLCDVVICGSFFIILKQAQWHILGYADIKPATWLLEALNFMVNCLIQISLPVSHSVAYLKHYETLNVIIGCTKGSGTCTAISTLAVNPQSPLGEIFSRKPNRLIYTNKTVKFHGCSWFSKFLCQQIFCSYYIKLWIFWEKLQKHWLSPECQFIK